MGLGRSTIANKLRILKLPDDALAHVAAGKLSERQAVAIVPAFMDVSEDDVSVLKADSAYWTTPESLLDAALKHGYSADIIRGEVSS